MYMFGSGSVPESSSKLAAKLLSCVPLPDRVSVAIFELSKIFPKNSYPGFSVSKRDDVVKLYLLWSSIISSSTRRHLSLMLYGSLNISFWYCLVDQTWTSIDCPPLYSYRSRRRWLHHPLLYSYSMAGQFKALDLYVDANWYSSPNFFFNNRRASRYPRSGGKWWHERTNPLTSPQVYCSQ